jgi:hypothetical protein
MAVFQELVDSIVSTGWFNEEDEFVQPIATNERLIGSVIVNMQGIDNATTNDVTVNLYWRKWIRRDSVPWSSEESEDMQQDFHELHLAEETCPLTPDGFIEAIARLKTKVRRARQGFCPDCESEVPPVKKIRSARTGLCSRCAMLRAITS